MFDIGMTELLVIGIVALIVVGPKDLPGMFRTLGRFTGKMKGMAREFQRAMDDAAYEAGVKDIRKDLKGMTSSKSLGLDRLNDAASTFEKWEPGKSAKSKGPETARLSEERAAKSARIRDATAKTAQARRDAEAASGREPGGATQSAAPVKETGNAAESPLTPAAERDG